MRFVHNAPVVPALGAASVSWSCGAMPHLLRVFDRAGIRFVTVQGAG